MIKFIPFDRYELESSLVKDEFVKHLKVATSGHKFFLWPQSTLKTNGIRERKIDVFHFKISRVSILRNDFIPMIIGEVESSAQGSKLKVLARLNYRAIILMSLFLLAWIILGIADIFKPGPFMNHPTLLVAGLFYIIFYRYSTSKTSKRKNSWKKLWKENNFFTG